MAENRQTLGEISGKMVLEGRLFVANRMTMIKEIVYEESSTSFSRNLEGALIMLCKELEIPCPMWMQKNTKEFSCFHQTIFFSESYIEKVPFDRFQIKLIE